MGTEVRADRGVDLVIADGSIAVANMGCGVIVLDQLDPDTKRLQRVVLTAADLEELLAWLA